MGRERPIPGKLPDAPLAGEGSGARVEAASLQGASARLSWFLELPSVQARGHAQAARVLWRSPTSSPARVLGCCLPAGWVTSWGPSLENVHDPQLQHQAWVPEHLPPSDLGYPGETRSPSDPAHPQDHVVQDNADDRDGGAQGRESGKTPWRRWHLHGVEEEQNPACCSAPLHLGVRTHGHTHMCALTHTHGHTRDATALRCTVQLRAPKSPGGPWRRPGFRAGKRLWQQRGLALRGATSSSFILWSPTQCR